MVLDGAGKDLVSVAHVYVEHFVFGVGPHHGDVAGGDHVLETDGVVGRSQGEQDLHILIQGGVGVPGVPLVGWGFEGRRQAFRYRVVAVVDHEVGGDGGPAVVIPNAAEESLIPGPGGFLFGVADGVEA